MKGSRLSRWFVFSALACFAIAFATPATAIGLCGPEAGQRDDGQRTEGQRTERGPDVEDVAQSEDDAQEEASVGVLMDAAEEVAPDAAPGTEIVDSIVPCAFLESGAFGAFCADVSVYVMTDNGLVLCQVPMLALEVEADADHELERRDANNAPSYQSGLHLCGWSHRAETSLDAPVVLSLEPTAALSGSLIGPSDRTLAVPTPPC